MKTYLLSLCAGALMGVLYALLRVRSPAPPAFALLGLFGMLVGQQIPEFVRHVVRNNAEPGSCGRLLSGPVSADRMAGRIEP